MKDTADKLVRFPLSRTRPPQTPGGFKDLGPSKLAAAVARAQPNLKGHWCSRCEGVWYGYVGECECPVCGNRNG